MGKEATTRANVRLSLKWPDRYPVGAVTKRAVRMDAARDPKKNDPVELIIEVRVVEPTSIHTYRNKKAWPMAMTISANGFAICMFWPNAV
jgi:hypothetical protein